MATDLCTYGKMEGELSPLVFGWVWVEVEYHLLPPVADVLQGLEESPHEVIISEQVLDETESGI